MDYRRQNIQENVDCIMKWFWAGRKGGDNGSNIHILGVSDFGDWLKGNVHEFSSF